MNRARIGILDSGIGREFRHRVACEQRFELDSTGEVVPRRAVEDVSGHGTAVARIITAAAQYAVLLNAQIFKGHGPTSAGAVASGIAWLVSEGADVVNMSFGLRADRRVLRDACTAALDAGVLLVAAMPARGDEVFPAAYEGVVSVTGDARCAVGEFSYLDNGRVDFGACPGPIGHVPHQPGEGSSLAVAHLAAKLAVFLGGGGGRERAVDWLIGQCRYSGREHRS